MGASPRKRTGKGASEPRGGNAPPGCPRYGPRVRALARIQVEPRTCFLFALSRLAWGVFPPLPPTLFYQEGADQHEKQRKNHGKNCGPVQGPGLHLRRQRDLWRSGQHLGLRPPGRGAEEQREKGLVEEIRPGEPL